jgi:serine/threonine protein kinase
MALDSASVRVTSRIASGRFGEVWMGTWDGVAVAVKTARCGTEFVDALLREVKIARCLTRHPNVVALFGAFTDTVSGEPRLVMELCGDGSLLEWLRRQGRVTVSQAVNVLTQVARGLRHLHNGGVFHRDLAARNVLVKGAAFKVTDFGLSSSVATTSVAHMTATTMGPVAWRAPETFHVDAEGRQIASRETDVYMLGGLMFEVLTAGQVTPFFWLPWLDQLVVLRSGSSANTLDAAAAAGVSVPWAIDGDADALRRLMARCLHADPLQRPSTDAVIDALADVDGCGADGYSEFPSVRGGGSAARAGIGAGSGDITVVTTVGAGSGVAGVAATSVESGPVLHSVAGSATSVSVPAAPHDVAPAAVTVGLSARVRIPCRSARRVYQHWLCVCVCL